MKKTLTLMVLCVVALVVSAQEYKTVENIPYHADAGEYAAERCKLDVYYQEGVPRTCLWWCGSTAEV